MMNVFVNAISTAEGGGFVVLKYLLEAVCREDPSIKWYVAADPYVIAQLPVSSSIIGLPYAWAKQAPVHHIFWYEIILPRLLRKIKADVCFSQTNFLPKRKISCPSLLLVHNAGYFSERFKQLYVQWRGGHRLIRSFFWEQKKKWVCRSIQQATAVTVQTYALAEKIINQTNISQRKISVIPHGPGILNRDKQGIKDFPHHPAWRIGYITKFGVQKDFNTAIKAVSQLKKEGHAVKLILTLNENSPEYDYILQDIHRYDVSDRIENNGDISAPEKIRRLYESLDMFVFPSWCESFGFTLVEAMAARLPLLIADVESNREVTGQAGIQFDSGNAEQLANKIRQLMLSEKLYQQASKNSLEKSREYSWNNAASSVLDCIQKITR